VGNELISVEDARRMVLERAAPLGDEPVPVPAALGRSLAEDIVAPDPIPPFDNSAMDGFAVVAADTAGAAPGEPVRLPLLDESRAGTPAGSALEPGAAIAISTGAAVPAGADAVVPIEDVEASQGEILLTRPVEPGRHIRRAGEVVAPGQQVLRAGVLCGPSELGVLTGVGRAEARCARRPRLAVLTTGDELRGPDEPMEPGAIRDANAVSLPALATASGAEVVSVSRVGDDRAATEAALAAGLEADVLVVSGGVSVGEHDHVRPALAALGVDQVFWRVALRPGKPTLFAVARSGTLVFGLPGNPVSSMVAFLLFVRPAIEAQLGLDPARKRGRAALGEPLPLLAARTQAVRCSLELSERGWTATSTGPQGSHVLTSMIGADCLAFIPPGEGELEAGAEVEFELLPGATVGGVGRGTLS
jgi:molybdopterin molybdotransferase